MGHLACKTHKRRVLVLPYVDGLDGCSQWDAIHRSDGSHCSDTAFYISGQEVSVLDMMEGKRPKRTRKRRRKEEDSDRNT